MKRQHGKNAGIMFSWFAIIGLMAPILVARAELTDITQTTPNVPGGAIGKSLQEQVGEQ